MTTISTLSTMQKSQSTRLLIAGQDKEVQRARQEVTTGIKADVFSDGSFRAAQSLDLRNRLMRADAFATSNKLLNAKMDVMSEAVSAIRGDAQEFLALSVAFGGRGQGDETLQAQAEAVLQRTMGYLNTIYAGEYLFSGTNTGQRSLTMPAGGFPTGTIAAPGGAAEVAAAISAVDAYFGLDVPYAAGANFRDQAYLGSDKLQSAQIDENAAIGYGVTAGDESLRLLYKGLTMLARTDVSAMTDDGQYEAWLSEANGAITRAITGLQSAEVHLGNNQAEVTRAIERQSKLSALYNNRIIDIEGVDSYEAATRLEALSAQLEASYAVTVRLKNLSLLNFL